MRLIKTIFLAALLISSVKAQDTAKIMSYNLLNYVASDTATRNPYFRTVMNSANPDILVAVEMTSQAMVNAFRDYVMNQAGIGVFTAGTFIDGPDTDNSIFFRANKFAFISNTPIHTALRDITQFKLVHLSTLDTFYIFAVHLKASTGTQNEQSRAAEVDSLRKVTNNFPAGTNFMVVGDFNFYASTEPAYIKLKAAGGIQGYFIDPITMTGTWNNGAYAPYHTQSPRVRQFGGGANGGMDDRFDLMIYSQGINDPGGMTYIPQSMIPYGNDGLHYNDSINRPPNIAVGQVVADALHYASDHLPVIAKFKFESPIGIINLTQVPKGFNLEQNFPNPFNPVTKIRFDIPAGLNGETNTKLIIYDVLGKEIATLVNGILRSGSYEYEWNGALYASGVYFYRLQTGSNSLVRKMVLTK